MAESYTRDKVGGNDSKTKTRFPDQYVPNDYQRSPEDLSTVRPERRGNLEEMERAIEHYSHALLQSAEESKDEPKNLETLANLHPRPFQRLAKLVGIDGAAERDTQASSKTLDAHADEQVGLNNLGNLPQNRFNYQGSEADQGNNKQVETHSRIVSPACEESIQMSEQLDTLGKSLHHRFMHFGELADIDRAIEYLCQAVLHAPNGHPLKSKCLNNLGCSYGSRFECLGELDDINNAIEYQNQAVLLTTGNNEDKATRLNNLGSFLRLRFGLSGESTDIDKAIQYTSQSLSLASSGHLERPAMLNSLGNSYHRRFEHLGNLEDIDKAIECKRQAISLTPNSHADRSTWLNNLGSSYQIRFARLGEVADIDSAIEYKTQAVSLIPGRHLHNAGLLSNLGNSHQRRFEHSGKLADLEKAIEYHSQSVSLTPDGHAEKAAQLNNLGNSYSARFEHLGELNDIENALKCHHQAVVFTPDGHADKPGWLENLGNSHHCRFMCLGAPEDIEKAITFKSQALWLTPDGHMTKTGLLTSLGRSYATRFVRLGNILDVVMCMSYLKAASQHPSGYPIAKLKASLAWAKISVMSRMSSPLEAYTQVMLLIPEVVWLGATADRRYQQIKSDIDNVAVEAAAVAISRGECNRALEWLEAGRSIVWNQLIQLRTPHNDLLASDPVLASDIETVARELENAASLRPSETQTQSLEEAAQQHRRLAEKWENLISRARLIPGMQNFLRPRQASELMTAAQAGAVVVINVHDTRCDALVLRPGCRDILHIPLANFSYKKAAECHRHLSHLLQIQGFRKREPRNTKEPKPQDMCQQALPTEPLAGISTHTQGNRRPVFHPMEGDEDPDQKSLFPSVLATLWGDVVKPVLEGLDYLLPPPANKLPHLTWCATGPLAFLPLHAAGCYDKSDSRTFNYVVSSYTPTLSTLIDSSQSMAQFRGILAVGQAASLPGTIVELDQIQNQAKNIDFTRLDGKHATPTAVLAGMEQHSWVHLACHASQNASDPTKSAFHLHNGRLDLGTLTKNALKNAQFAFLSACETAMGDERLSEEAVHLAAGMMVAGCPAVIASMWPIEDKDAPMVAKEVYAYMLKGGVPDSLKSAEALHFALGSLRDQVGEAEFTRWVPYIHFGG